MTRKTASFPVEDIETIKQQMLNWADRFNICCFLDNHQYHSGYHAVECLVAAGAHQLFSPGEEILPSLQQFIDDTPDWLIGHIGYDLKNEIAGLTSTHPDEVGFPPVVFFQPQVVLQLQDAALVIASITEEPESVFLSITSMPVATAKAPVAVTMHPRMDRDTYLAKVESLLGHIQRGDCYEINFCQEFFAENATINPAAVYNRLTEVSPNPFSCFYRCGDRYLLCASPERYLQKKGGQIISQPIKGTLKRDTSNAAADDLLKQQLLQSAKDRSENVMVVDIVRNDLSRVCTEGSVQVSELFGIYSFPQVHQMISTISGRLKPGSTFTNILQATFPMGSMTGAPKKRVMELVEQYEVTRRGLYSGAVGYISPGGDFDFNVVIRSIQYNADSRYLNYLVGGGITAYSNPEKEYEECLLKAEAMQLALR